MFGQIQVVLGMLVLVLAFMGLFMYICWWLTRTPKITLSPYTGMPLWTAGLLPFPTKKKIALYLDSYKQYDNRVFKFGRAAYCRDTGRIFPDCVNWRNKIVLDWSFLQKRYPGNWISWGSLSDELKEKIRNMHESLDGFQTAYSSKQIQPKAYRASLRLCQAGPSLCGPGYRKSPGMERGPRFSDGGLNPPKTCEIKNIKWSLLHYSS